MSRNYSKHFWSKKAAEEFIKELEYNGAEDIELSSALDGFGQTQWRVAWNFWR